MSNFATFNIKLNHKWVCWCFDVDLISLSSVIALSSRLGIELFKRSTLLFLVDKPTEEPPVKVTLQLQHLHRKISKAAMALIPELCHGIICSIAAEVFFHCCVCWVLVRV